MPSPSAQGHKHINHQPRQDWRWLLLWALAVLAAVLLVAELTRRATEPIFLNWPVTPPLSH